MIKTIRPERPGKRIQPRQGSRLCGTTKWTKASRAYVTDFPFCVLCAAQGRINDGALHDTVTRQRRLIMDHIEPQPEVGVPRCPRRFKGDARKLWTAIGKQMVDCGVATKLDAPALEVLIETCVQYMQASEQVGKTGPVWLEESDGVIPKFVKNPNWVVQLKTGQQLLSMLREFGMTPSARTTVKSVVPLTGQHIDPAERYSS
jgi:P27 family predicted phage terminase small subunit